MSKTYKKDEVLENGHHQISVYDGESHSLLSTYQTMSDGKKDGEEIEYFEDSTTIKRQTNWKNGKKHGVEKIYTNDFISYSGGEQIISVENEYKDGICTNNREYFHDIGQLDFVVKFLNKTISGRGLDLSRHYDGTYSSYVSRVRASVIKENGEFKHITLEMGRNKTFYDMEFKDGKEYTGNFDSGRFEEGKLTGSVPIPLEQSPCAEFVPSGTGYSRRRCWQIFENGVLVSNDASYHWSDGFDGWNYRIHIPVNGVAYKREAEDGLIWSFNMKDGKRDGEYNVKGVHAFYKNGELDGEYVKNFDRWDKIRRERIYGQFKKSYKEGIESDTCEYTEFFDDDYKKKKIEGSLVKGKKEGIWKYYNKDGEVINQEVYRNGRNVTKKYETIKNVASKRIEEEKAIEKETGKKTILPKMSKLAKVKAIVGAKRQH